MVIPLDKANPKVARSKLGSYYERFPGGTNTLFGKRGASVQLKDLKGRFFKRNEHIQKTKTITLTNFNCNSIISKCITEFMQRANTYHLQTLNHLHCIRGGLNSV